MELCFDWNSPDRVVTFEYKDGKTYTVRKFDSLTVEEVRNMGGKGTEQERAAAVALCLLKEAGLENVETIPQDFLRALFSAMGNKGE